MPFPVFDPIAEPELLPIEGSTFEAFTEQIKPLGWDAVSWAEHLLDTSYSQWYAFASLIRGGSITPETIVVPQ